jgi:hypothetical protein
MPPSWHCARCAPEGGSPSRRARTVDPPFSEPPFSEQPVIEQPFSEQPAIDQPVFDQAAIAAIVQRVTG